MSLEGVVNAVKSTVRGVHDYFVVPGKANDMAKYAMNHYIDHDIKHQLFDGKSEEEKAHIYRTLEDTIQERLDYHQKHLDKLSLKAGKLTGLAALLNSAYHTFRGTPFDNFAYVQYFLIGSKALLELPAMYSYFKDTKDVYGTLEWLAAKPIAGLIPIIGPAFDLNVAQRVMKKRIIKEGVEYFLKQTGTYKERGHLMDKIYDRVKNVTGEPMPEPGSA